jgi:ATP-dependent Clp protease ATP-binding subunit ClpC
MFFSNNLSEKTQVVMAMAAAEAEAMKQFYIGTEHIFIGLCKIDDEAVREVFTAFNINPLIRNEIRSRVSKRSASVWGRELLMTPRVNALSKIILELIKTYQFPEIEPLHVFLALLRAGDGVVVRLLQERGFNLELLQSTLEDKLEQHAATVKLFPSTEKTPFLNKIGRDLTLLAHRGKLEVVVGRKNEIKKIAQILTMKKKNNPMLIGEAGVGKTAVVEGLAKKLIESDIPEELQKLRIIEISLTALVAGTKYRGDFESRLQKLLEEASKNKEVVLFIDEIHNLVGAGNAIGGMDAANVLKPALARGEIRCIGATTINEYRQYIEKDAALERRFQPVPIEEPTREQALEIVQGIKESYEKYYQNIVITPEALVAAVDLSIRYVKDRKLPDKAIDLIDQAIAKKRLTTLVPVKPEEASDAKNQKKILAVTEDEIAEVVSEWTGIPAQKLTEKEKESLLKIEEVLSKAVVGQEKAIEAVANGIRIVKAGLRSLNRPLGVFLFLGPTGVGKTELAKAIAEFLFNAPQSLIRFDMSEYMEPHTVSKLIGAPPGYVGYEQDGLLTALVRKNPYCVLLFDEIEKAHDSIFNLFLQVFDEGRLTDSKGKQIDFTNAIIIMTSNIAGDLAKKPALGFQGTVTFELENEKKMKELNNLLREKFRDEFLNRIDKKILFNSLDQKEIRLIIDKFLAKLEKRLSPNRLSLHLDEEVYQMLIHKGYSEQYGAREMDRVIQQEIVEPLAKLLLQNRFVPVTKIFVTIDNKHAKFLADDELPTQSKSNVES